MKEKSQSKLFYIIIGILVSVLLFYFSYDSYKKNTFYGKVRTVSSMEEIPDYGNFFAEFVDLYLSTMPNKNTLNIRGTRLLGDDIIDYLGMEKTENSNINEPIAVVYDFTYNVADNIFCIEITAEREDDIFSFDHFCGIPFLNDDGEIDILFNADGYEILLSDLERNSSIEYCGWFTSL